jgi:hypothetical protein
VGGVGQSNKGANRWAQAGERGRKGADIDSLQKWSSRAKKVK